jgi:hypothetical protein
MDIMNRAPEFSGKQEEWHKWSKTFLCRATLRGYKKIILKREGDEEDWAKDEWEILNELAYAELLIGCQDYRCFGIINGARTTIWHGGC